MTRSQSPWSRRRAAVAAEAAAEDQAAQAVIIAQQQEALADKNDAEILEELGLPDPDAMVQGDDFKAFLAKTVPAHLRKRALRNLWRSNPVLACVDGLNDYDDDYLTGSYGQGPIATTYQVGKGMLSHLVEMERQKEAASAQPAVDDEPAAAEDAAPVDDLPEAVMVAQDAHAPVSEDEVAAAPQADEQPLPAPRRMTFQFEEDAA